ncbi:hypothetical protein HELRODRAFT_170382 [Helobdella robusta]|uniref:G-protein coupled receptors family 1 profile domain-containing protein n=1 Tax=Helobdella robusta TaxID=6412 RepID=T1F2Z3_HELRO|nr:hypothetical protein HELRODRAFT_170382 [Helobdella robusta]ESO07823.1 hypothetical protein HELRODRAFT_170382 [Helobdella robusta]
MAKNSSLLSPDLPLIILQIFCKMISGKICRSSSAKLGLLRAVCELLMYLNHAINFYLYCSTGDKFRKEFCRVFTSKSGNRGQNNRCGSCSSCCWPSDQRRCDVTKNGGLNMKSGFHSRSLANETKRPVKQAENDGLVGGHKSAFNAGEASDLLV